MSTRSSAKSSASKRRALLLLEQQQAEERYRMKEEEMERRFAVQRQLVEEEYEEVEEDIYFARSGADAFGPESPSRTSVNDWLENSVVDQAAAAQDSRNISTTTTVSSPVAPPLISTSAATSLSVAIPPISTSAATLSPVAIPSMSIPAATSSFVAIPSMSIPAATSSCVALPGTSIAVASVVVAPIIAPMITTAVRLTAQNTVTSAIQPAVLPATLPATAYGAWPGLGMQPNIASTLPLQMVGNLTAPGWQVGDSLRLLDAVEKGHQRQEQMITTMQLPKIQIRQFDGDPLFFYSFMKQFEANVGRYAVDDATKLSVLVQSCTGRAAHAVQSCQAEADSSIGYARALRQLKERFGSSYLITQAWLNKVLKRDAIKNNDYIALMDFADDIRNCIDTLNAAGLIAEISTQGSLLLIVEKLPHHLQLRWRREACELQSRFSRLPTIDDISNFISHASQEANDPIYGRLGIPSSKTTSTNFKFKGAKLGTNEASFSTQATTNSNTATRERKPCFKCKGQHALYQCNEFKAMTQLERFQFTSQHKLCHNCLGGRHTSAECRCNKVCAVTGCGKRHHTLLHRPGGGRGGQTDTSSGDGATSGTMHSSQGGSEVNEVSLATAAMSVAMVSLPVVPVYARSPDGSYCVETCALLDNGSTGTFCTAELARKLHLHGQEQTLSITTLNGRQSNENTSIVSFVVMGFDEPDAVTLQTVYTKSKLHIQTELIAPRSDVQQWSHLRNVRWPQLKSPQIEIIIGLDVPEAHVPLQVISGRAGEPYATRTMLGWTVNGPVGTGSHRITSFHVTTEPATSEQLQRFWQYEDQLAYTLDGSQAISADDSKVIELWDARTSRDQGHYVIPIPLKNEDVVSNNRPMAEQRLRSLKWRLSKNTELKSSYDAGMEDMFNKGYAERVPVDEMNVPRCWYLPHHPVISSSKPGKVRIVLDCAAQWHGLSLNDQVMQGPNLTNSLLGVLLRFRQEKIALMADIECMFYQVKVPERQRNVLKFLWWPKGDSSSTPEEFRLTVHPFGGVWSPSCASYALRRAAVDGEGIYSESVRNTIMRNFYVDDLLKSVGSEEEAVSLAIQLSSLLSSGGFRLTKWLSNNKRVLSGLPADDLAATVKNQDLYIDKLPNERSLGVTWRLEEDLFSFEVLSWDKPSTRRGMLSALSSLYDPLGLVSPFVLRGRLILQELTCVGIGWDEELPCAIAQRWEEWVADLPLLSDFTISRCVKPKNFGTVLTAELHHFSDASLAGYGTASYLRLTDDLGHVHCILLIGKSRLVPAKKPTIPRLELMAAALSIQQDAICRQEMDIVITNSVYWTDSTIVLQYIRNKSRRFHVFVANRINMIHAGSRVEQWHHVEGVHNPADHASRGLSAPALLQSKEWVNGPAYLWSLDYSSYLHDDEAEVDMADPEVKVTETSFAVSLSLETQQPTDRLLASCSSWRRLSKRVVVFMRFIDSLKIAQDKGDAKMLPLSARITSAELQQAESRIMRYVQSKCLTNKSTCKLQLQRLRAYMDDDGLMRVGGRLQQSLISEEAKHPVILPGNHKTVELLARQVHECNGHVGSEHVLSLLRERYWIIGGRRLIRRIVHQCIRCKRILARPQQQLMGQLPAVRVTASTAPFDNVGVDVFGPFEVKIGRSVHKRYGCIFVCMSSRAIHIEVLHSMDTSSFLQALFRFISRRGPVLTITCDNGSNFVGAERELADAMKSWNEKQVDNELKHKGIQWSFNPPTASNMGGCWERHIRSVRKILKGLCNEQKLTDETLLTLLTQVEGIMNSRPITTVSDDPDCIEPLSPSQLLTLKRPQVQPVDVFVKQDVYARRRWRQVQFLAGLFWQRWQREYLPMLQRRDKWTVPRRNIRLGDVVLLHDSNAPRGTWPLARVLEVFPGSDGLVRSARIKVKDTILVRPVNKMSLLEAAD
jgi:hypothetical protein